MRQKSSRWLALSLALAVAVTSLPHVPARAAEQLTGAGEERVSEEESMAVPESQEETQAKQKTAERETEDTGEETEKPTEESEEESKEESKGETEEASGEGSEPETAEPALEEESTKEAEPALEEERVEEAEPALEEERVEETEPASVEETKETKEAGAFLTDAPQVFAAQLQAENGDAASTGVKVLKEKAEEGKDREYGMFKICGSVVKTEGSQTAVAIYTNSKSYTKIAWGEEEADAKANHVTEGSVWNQTGWSFSFSVPQEMRGKEIPVYLWSKESEKNGKPVPAKWYSSQALVLSIPAQDGTYGTVTEDAEKPEEPAPVPKPDPVPDPEPAPLPGQASENTYDVIQVESSAAMFRVTDCVLVSKNGKTDAVITLSGTGYDYLYPGSSAEAEAADPQTWIPFAENAAGAYTYTIPAVELDTPVAVAAHSKKNNQWYDRTLTFQSESRKRIAKEGDYQTEVESNASMFKVVNCVLTSREGNMSAVITLSGTGYDYLYPGTAAQAKKADSSAWISFAENGDGAYTYNIPVSALDTPIPIAAHSKRKNEWYDRELTFQSGTMRRTVEDGTYRVPVESSAAMFRVVDCILTAKGGSMSAVITLSGTGYDSLYLGTAADAGTASSRWIAFAENEEGAYTYRLPVSALNTPIQVAAHSKKNDKWYDRTLIFQTEGMVKLSGGDGQPEKPGGEERPGGQEKPGGTPGGNGGQTEPPVPDNTADTESAYESDTSGSTRRVDSSVTLPDGVYKPDKFSWSGGTGRVSISCPKITVTGGRAYATLIFSSDSYTYIKANGNRYQGTAGGGRSTFVIPVELNKNNTIIGMTTKMSASHEITYSIYIYLAAAEKGAGTAGDGNGLLGDTLDEEAPDIMGLTYESETKVEYARKFKLYHYNDGITLLEIDLTDKDEEKDGETAQEEPLEIKKEETETAWEPEEDPENEGLEEEGADGEFLVTEAEITAGLYREKVVKYLLVPEEAELPVGLEKEAVIIRVPSEGVYAASEEALETLKLLDMLDVLTAAGFEKEDCPVEELAAAMETKAGETEAKTVFGGVWDDPDFKTLLERKCSLALFPGELLPREEKEEEWTFEEQKERFERLTERFAMLSIPVVIDRSSDEETELAAYEWIKAYGVIFGCEKEAEALFAEEVEAAEKAEKRETGETEEEGAE